MPSSQHVSPIDLERETGLSKDLLRKWRERYGFPTPESLSDGAFGYSREQIRQLRLIKRLLDGGFRPAQVVGKSIAELDRLFGALSCNDVNFPRSKFTTEAIARLKRLDLTGLRSLLADERSKSSLSDFVQDSIAPLVVAIGDAWALRELEVYHEHLISDELMRLLHAELRVLKHKRGFPKIMFATPPEEIHVLGLLMAEVVLAEQGAECINIGPQIAMEELAMAAKVCHANIVAMSFSFAYPARRVKQLLEHLRKLLPVSVEIWIGGAGGSHIRHSLKNVFVFNGLPAAAGELMKRCQ